MNGTRDEARERALTEGIRIFGEGWQEFHDYGHKAMTDMYLAGERAGLERAAQAQTEVEALKGNVKELRKTQRELLGVKAALMRVNGELEEARALIKYLEAKPE